MDHLYLVQWLGCVTALAGGGVVVAWQPDEVRLTRRRLAALVVAGLVVAFAVVRWGMADLESSGHEAVELATAVTGQVGIAALVVLALLLSGAAPGSRSAQRLQRRAAGALCGGFAVAVAATLQVSLVGERWTATQALLVLGQLLGCVALVLAHPERDGDPAAN